MLNTALERKSLRLLMVSLLTAGITGSCFKQLRWYRELRSPEDGFVGEDDSDEERHKLICGVRKGERII